MGPRISFLYDTDYSCNLRPLIDRLYCIVSVIPKAGLQDHQGLARCNTKSWIDNDLDFMRRILQRTTHSLSESFPGLIQII